MNDRYEYLYAIVDTNGVCWVLRDNTTEKVAGIASLLADGWRPLRESAFHQVPYMMLVLERDARGSGAAGFGFSGS